MLTKEQLVALKMAVADVLIDTLAALEETAPC